MKSNTIRQSHLKARCKRRSAMIQFASNNHELRDTTMAKRPIFIHGKKERSYKISILLIIWLLTALLHPATSLAATEPSAAAAPSLSNINYFDVTVTYSVPSDADGVLVVVRQSAALQTPPYDGTEYTANSRIGDGDTTEPGCIMYCEYVVADSAFTGSPFKVTGLKEGIDHYFAVYSYNGTGVDINYNQNIDATMATTATVPLEGTSHNELWVASDSPKDGTAGGTMTATECANCHGTHHTSQLLPTGLAMADNCFTCHSDAGDVSMHAGSTVDCGTCHSLHSFRTEELYPDNGVTANEGFNLSFVRKNMTKYFNTDNGFTTDALEPTVFQVRPDDFAHAASPFNAICQTCHTDAVFDHHYQTGTDGHYIGNICINCHSHTGTNTDNGFKFLGHTEDFGKDATCTRCHSGALVMEDIHGDGTIADCTLCHDGTPNRDNEKLGDSIVGKSPVGDARLADGLAAAIEADPINNHWYDVTCLTCHPKATYPTGDIHHDLPNATAGECIVCHKPDVGQGASSRDLTNLDISMPRNLACNWCHLYWPNDGYSQDTSSRVRIYGLRFNPNASPPTGEFGVRATTTELTTHTISTSTNPPISDYAACFECHGATSYTGTAGTAPQVIPFHGLGTPYSGDDGTGGNIDDLINAYSGPQYTGTSQPMHTIPFHPAFNALNWLEDYISYNATGRTNNPYTNWGNRRYHRNDSQQHERENADYYNYTGSDTSFDIPWDDYGPGTPPAPGTVDVNSGGETGTKTVNTTIPTVPLTLP